MGNKIINIVSALLLVAGFASCDREGRMIPEPQEEIAVSPGLQTRAVISGPDMPDGFHIWVSSWLNDEVYPGGGLNYFTGVEFAKDGTEWKSNPARYWPLSGTLDFLGIAADPAELTLGLNWDSAKNVSRVEVDVPDTYDSQSEVFYAASYPLEGFRGSVPMEYHRSQAVLRFMVRTDVLDLIKVDDITIKGLYTAGTLTVEGDGPLKASWDFSSATASDRSVPKPSATYVFEPGGSFEEFGLGIVVPEQVNQPFVISFRQRANTGIAWDSDLVLEQTYEFDDTFRKWFMGKQYVYNIDISLTSITVEPVIEDGFI